MKYYGELRRECMVTDDVEGMEKNIRGRIEELQCILDDMGCGDDKATEEDHGRIEELQCILDDMGCGDDKATEEDRGQTKKKKSVTAPAQDTTPR